MRNLLPALAALALASTGCGHCGSSTGWRFEVLSPPVVMSPSIVASGPAPLGTIGMGTVAHTESQAVQLVQSGPCVTQTPIAAPVRSAAIDCATLQEACDRIRALEAQMRAQRLKEMAPMPSKEPAKNPSEE